jgi:hypothetical protein
MTEVEFFQILSRMLTERHNKVISVGVDTDLLAGGLVDSLTMFDVLLLGEKCSGREVSIEDLDIDIFQSASRLYGVFFG